MSFLYFLIVEYQIAFETETTAFTVIFFFQSPSNSHVFILQHDLVILLSSLLTIDLLVYICISCNPFLLFTFGPHRNYIINQFLFLKSIKTVTFLVEST